MCCARQGSAYVTLKLPTFIHRNMLAFGSSVVFVGQQNSIEPRYTVPLFLHSSLITCLEMSGCITLQCAILRGF
jgi:hypothetical protein